MQSHCKAHQERRELEVDTVRGIPAAKAAELGTCEYIEQGMTIIITGPAGTGKSYFAQALGERACRLNYKTDLLIIDDIGMSKIQGDLQNDFEQIIDDRYHDKALILCSQLPVADYYGLFQSELIAEACLDRIVHKSMRFQLAGDSLRKKY